MNLTWKIRILAQSCLVFCLKERRLVQNNFARLSAMCAVSLLCCFAVSQVSVHAESDSNRVSRTIGNEESGYSFTFNLVEDSIVFLQSLWIRTEVTNISNEVKGRPILGMIGPVLNARIVDEMDQPLRLSYLRGLNFNIVEGDDLLPGQTIAKFDNYKQTLWDPYEVNGIFLDPGTYGVAITLTPRFRAYTKQLNTAVDTVVLPFTVSRPQGEDNKAFNLLRAAYMRLKDGKRYLECSQYCKRIIDDHPTSSLVENAYHILVFLTSNGFYHNEDLIGTWSDIARRATNDLPSSPFILRCIRLVKKYEGLNAATHMLDSLSIKHSGQLDILKDVELWR